jgi:hypothetical protein
MHQDAVEDQPGPVLSAVDARELMERSDDFAARRQTDPLKY